MKSCYCQAVIIKWLIAGLCGLLLWSCGGTEERSLRVFRYNSTNTIASLDPAFAKSQEVIWAVKQLYNTLVEPDSNLVIRPSLAKGWQVSEDHRTYTFDLRTDVYFHDSDIFPGGKGRRMTAQDVVYSLRRIMDPATASPGAWIFNGKLSADSGFRALNDSTFQLTLYRPFHPVLGILSMQYCSIVPHEAVEKYGKDFRNHPCGTGPFRFFFGCPGAVEPPAGRGPPDGRFGRGVPPPAGPSFVGPSPSPLSDVSSVPLPSPSLEPAVPAPPGFAPLAPVPDAPDDAPPTPDVEAGRGPCLFLRFGCWRWPVGRGPSSITGFSSAGRHWNTLWKAGCGCRTRTNDCVIMHGASHNTILAPHSAHHAPHHTPHNIYRDDRMLFAHFIRARCAAL